MDHSGRGIEIRKDHELVRQESELALYEKHLNPLADALKFGTELQKRMHEFNISIGHDRFAVPLAYEKRGHWLSQFAKADAAYLCLRAARSQRPDREMMIAMVAPLLGTFGARADTDILKGMLAILEGDEIARVTELWQALNVSPAGLALACQKLMATATYVPRPVELGAACRDAENRLRWPDEAAAKLVEAVRRWDAVLLQFDHDKWEKPYSTPEYRPILPRMLQLHNIYGDGRDDWDDDDDNPLAQLIKAELAKLAPSEQKQISL